MKRPRPVRADDVEFKALHARAAYLRGDIDVEQFERVLDVDLGLAKGNVAWLGVGGPEWIMRPRGPRGLWQILPQGTR